MPGFLRKTVIFLAFVFCVIFAAPAAYAACCDAGSYGSGKGCTACPAPFNNSNNVGKVCPNTTINSCYLTLPSGYYYNGKSGAVEVCPTGYTCPGGATVYYGETGQIGRTANCNLINRDKNPPNGMSMSLVPELYKKTGSTAWYSDDTCTTQQTTPTNIPTYSGYICTGFYTEESGGTRVIDQNGNLLSWYASQPTYIYAQWIKPIVTVSLNNQSATTAGSTAVYERYNTGIYLDAAATSQQMTTSTNHITLPTRTGYTFGGYYTGTNGTGTQLINASGYITNNFTTTRFTAGTTIYAKWTSKVLTVTLDDNYYATSSTQTGEGVRDGVEPTTIYLKYNTGWYSNAGATTVFSSLTNRPNYGSNYPFYGFYTGKAGTGTKVIDENGNIISGNLTVCSQNCTLYAYYPQVYTVTFKTGNTTLGTQTFLNGESKALTAVSNFTQPVSSTYGWGFYGWRTNYGSTARTYTDGQSITPAANITLYGIWYRSVLFKRLSSATSTSFSGYGPYQYYYNTTAAAANVSSVTPPSLVAQTTYNWAPIGWVLNNTTSTTPTISQLAGATPVAITPAKDVVTSPYYALYNRQVTLVYNGNTNTGGTTENTIDKQYLNAGQNVAITLPMTLGPNGFTKDGYSFNKWAAGSTSGTLYSDGGTFNFPNKAIASSNTYNMYATWNQNCNAITFDNTTNNSGATPTSSVLYKLSEDTAWYDNNTCSGTPVTTLTTIPTIANGRLYGVFWSANSQGTIIVAPTAVVTQTYELNPNLPVSAPHTVYAHYVCDAGYTFNSTTKLCAPNTITLDWDENGGNAINNGSCDYGDDLILPAAPTRPGYTFTGWKLANNTTQSAGATVTGGCTSTYTGVTSGTSTAIQAQWTPNCNAITLDNTTRGGSTANTTLYKYTNDPLWYSSKTNATTCATAVTTVAAPSKTHATFSGYYLSPTNTTTNVASSASPSVLSTTWTVNAPTTIYAHYNCDEYYDDGGLDIAGACNPDQCQITLNNADATTNGTTTLYTTYGVGVYLDSARTQSMTTSSNPITTPSRVGYSFDGYFGLAKARPQYILSSGLLNSNGYNAATSGSYCSTWDTGWTPNTITLNWDENGGNAIANGSCDYDDDLILPSAPTRPGYTFTGWKLANNTTQSAGATITGGCTSTYTGVTSGTSTAIQAQWSAQSSTVTLNSNGGTAGSVTSVTATYDAAMPTISGNGALPTRPGYTFDGYGDDATTGGIKYYNADGTSAHTWDKTGNQILYAIWEANCNEITINVSANGGTLNGDAESVTLYKYTDGDYWSTHNLCRPRDIITTLTDFGLGGLPTKTNATYSGVFENQGTPAGAQAIAADGTLNNSWNITQDTTIYAHYNCDANYQGSGTDISGACTGNTSTVTLNANGGSGGTDSVTATYGSAMPSATMPTRTGYTFVGYYDTDAATGGTQYYTSAGASARTWDKTGAQTLWARWTVNTYTVTFKTGNTILGTQNFTYGVAQNLTTLANLSNVPAALSQNGWRFSGWKSVYGNYYRTYTDGQSVSNLTQSNGGNIVLYGIWERNVNFVKIHNQSSGGIQKYYNTDANTTGLTSVTSPTLTNDTTYGWSPLGYVFNDTTSTTVTIQQQAGDSGVPVTPAVDVGNTYYAVYNRTATLTYDGNENTGGSAPANTTGTQVVNVGANVAAALNMTLASNTFTKTNYTFSKWASGSVNGTQYDAGATNYPFPNTAWASSATNTMYAIWTPNVIASASDKQLTYNGSAQSCANVTVTTPASGYTIKYSNAANGTFTTTVPTMTNVSESPKTIYYQVSAPNHITATGSYSCSMVNAADVVTIMDGSTNVTNSGSATTFPNNKVLTASCASGAIPTISNSGTASVATTTISNGTITMVPVAAGATTSTITVKCAAASNYNPATATYTLTVNKGTITHTPATLPGNSKVYDTQPLSCTGGITGRTPSNATMQYAEKTGNSCSGVSYSSTVPSRTNVGTTTVCYKLSAANYNDKLGEYSCTVTQASGSTTIKDGNTDVTNGSGSVVYPSTKSLTAICAGGATISSVTSGTTSVATVSNSGNNITITPVAAGATTSTITVNCPATTNYAASSATYTITVNKGTCTVSLSAASGSTAYPVTKQITASSNSGGTLSVASSAESVATAAISNGTVTMTPVAQGNATITVTSAATSNYNSCSASYALTVNRGTCTMTLTPTSGTVTYPGTTTTFNIDKGASNGAVSTSLSNNTSSATVALSSNDTVGTVTYGTSGGVTVTVTAAQTNQYNSCSATYTGTAADKIITLKKNGGTGTCGGATGVNDGTLACTLGGTCTAPSWNSSTCNITNGAKVFDGWATSANGAVAYAPGANLNNAPTTLYAHWSNVTCSVTNGTGTAANTSNNAPRCNVTCNDGYHTSGTYTGTGTTVTYACTGNDITLDWDENGGGAIANGSCTYGGDLTLPAAPSRTGYTFTKWKLADGTLKDASSTVTNGCIYTYTNKYSGTSTAIQAQWTPIVYTVNLDAKYYTSASATSGTNPTTAVAPTAIYQKYNTGWYTTNAATTAFTALTTKPTYSTYIFEGFWTGKTGTGTKVINSDGTLVSGVSTTLFTANGTLYAKWTQTTCSVTNGTGTATTPSNNAPRCAVTCNDGYSTSGTYTGTGTTVTYACTGNDITLDWDENGGGAINSGSCTYGGNLTLPAAPSRTGYTFTKWKLADGTLKDASSTVTNGCIYTYTNKYSGTSTAIQAQWTANTNTPYTVYHYIQGVPGSTYTQYGNTETLYGTTGATVTLATLKKTITGYTYLEGFAAGPTGNVKPSSGAVLETTILANGSRVITLYYNRDTREITLDNANATTNGTSTIYTRYQDGVWLNSARTSPLTTTSGAITKPQRTGYTFNGYYSQASGGTQYISNIGRITQEGIDVGEAMTASSPAATWHAQWSPNTYSISYAGMGGATHGDSHPTSATYDVEFTVSNPTKTGYDFAGWNITGMDSTTHYYGATTADTSTTATSLNNIMVTKFKNLRTTFATVTFTAVWNPKTTAITLDKNAADAVAGTTSVTGTYSETLPTVTIPTRLGYSFRGYWDTNAASGGNQYYKSDGTSYRTWNKTEATATLYGRWNLDFYTISYALNGGTNSANNPSNWTITDSSMTLTRPTRANSTFTGWTVTTAPTAWGTGSSSSGALDFVVGQGTYGDIAFEATWACNTGYSANNDGTACVAQTSTVTFNKNASDAVAGTPQSVTATYGSAMPTPVTSPTRPGYTFMGYYDTPNATGGTQYYGGYEGNGSGNIQSAHVWDKVGDQTLYARWAAKCNKITFDGTTNGGTSLTGKFLYKLTDGTAWYTSNKCSGTTVTTLRGASITPPTKSNAMFTGFFENAGIPTGTKVVDDEMTMGALSTTWTVNADTTLHAHYDCDEHWQGNGVDISGACDSGTQYTIYYVMNGGTNYAGAPASYTYGTGATINGTPTREHSGFGGWCTDSGLNTCTGTQTISTTDYGDKTYYAKWKCLEGYSANNDGSACVANTITLNWNENGGSAVANGSCTYNGDLILPAAPSRTGYTFVEWVLYDGTAKSAGTTVDNGCVYEKTGVYEGTSTSITARWSPNTYTIAYAGMTGATHGDNHPTSATYDEDVKVSAPSKPGYTFAGWNISGMDTTTHYHGTTSANTAFNTTTLNGTMSTKFRNLRASSGTVTFTATWTANTNTAYKVYHYTKNLGATTYTQNGNVDNLTGTSDATLTLVNLKRTITGFTYSEGFAGTAATGTTKPTSGAVTTTTILADGTRVISLYYNRDTHTVTLAKGTCSAVSGGGTYEYGANVSISATPGTGYDWVKWTQTSGGAQVSTANPYAFTMGTSNLSYTANCTPSTYTITYTMNGGDNYTNAPTSYTYGTGATINGTPTRANSTFTGWTGDNGNTPQTTVTISTTATGDKNYTANWSCLDGYHANNDGTACVGNTITLNYANGGHGTAPAAGSCTYGSTFDLPLLTAAGYTFDEWHVNNNAFDNGQTGVACNYANLGVYSGSVTITATWNTDVYTVTLSDGTGAAQNGAPSPIYLKYNDGWYSNQSATTTISALTTTPIKVGYLFDGYYTGENGTGTQIINNAGTIVANNTAITADTTIYAKYTAQTGFTVTTVDDMAAGTTFKFAISAAGRFYVDWGDGTVQPLNRTSTTTELVSHQYTTGGSKNITIYGRATGYGTAATISAVCFGNCTDVTRDLVGGISGSLANVFPNVPGNSPKFYKTFANCTNLTGSIPPNLFTGLGGSPQTYQFAYLFSGNNGLTGTIPSGFFGGVTGTVQTHTFDSTFFGCSGLQGGTTYAIPENLFANMRGSADSAFISTFSGCAGLTGKIPANLFANLNGRPQQNMFRNTFSSCSGLTGTIPADLFGNLSGAAYSGAFGFMFYRCSGLSGYVPRGLFAGITGADASHLSMFNGSGLVTECPCGMKQYMTGFENSDGKINTKVSCEFGTDDEFWYNGKCIKECDAGVTKLKTSNGLSVPLLKAKATTKNVAFKHNNKVCYSPVETGNLSGHVNLKQGATTYHISEPDGIEPDGFRNLPDGVLPAPGYTVE